MSGEVTGVDRSAGVDRARQQAARGAAGAGSVDPTRFGALLDGNLRRAKTAGEGAPLRWSGHAVDRLTQRRTAVSEAMQERLAGAVDDLAGKGARQSVVLVDDLAFVVSVSNRTVITAVGADRMKDQIFTNIDSVAVR